MTFIIVTRDELWSLDRRSLLESRLVHGSADQRGDTIEARDDCDERLLMMCESESERVREALGSLREGRARFVVSALPESVVATISITVLDLSVVSTLPYMRSDYETLREMASVRPARHRDYRGIPVVWRNGSGAVLLHEAAGHPAEHGHPALRWPQWLTAVDGDADLLAGEAPKAMRRQSFTDVPLRRMTNVVVNATMTMPLPPRRIEILLVAGGRYEPLTGSVSLSISAADFVDSGESVRLRPFVILESREAVARAVRGAAGPARRYPGVICTKEGQELFVGSHSPDLVTEF